VATINVLDDGVGMISDNIRSFHLLNVNSSQEVTFLGLHVVAILGNILIVLGE